MMAFDGVLVALWWLVGWLVGWSVGWFMRLAGWLVGWRGFMFCFLLRLLLLFVFCFPVFCFLWFSDGFSVFFLRFLGFCLGLHGFLFVVFPLLFLLCLYIVCVHCFLICPLCSVSVGCSLGFTSVVHSRFHLVSFVRSFKMRA